MEMSLRPESCGAYCPNLVGPAATIEHSLHIRYYSYSGALAIWSCHNLGPATDLVPVIGPLLELGFDMAVIDHIQIVSM
jgi:hypothetical protein